MTQEEIERVQYMWLSCPCTFQEIMDDINQFRDEPVTEKEVWEVIDKLI